MAFQSINYLAGSSSGEIVLKKSERVVGDQEVLLRVICSGVCGTDAHDRRNGCGLGHEGVGEVVGLGKSVVGLKEGMRVGWGWQFMSCGHCKVCVEGYRQYCKEACGQKYGELEQGAFGDFVVKRWDWVYPIPEEIESVYAAPLQCAGVTVYEALDAAGVKAADRVGIIGLGGLGHLAIQYAKAMGCDPILFSGDPSKRDDAIKLGAKEFCCTSEIKAVQNLDAFGEINILLICAAKMPNFELFLPLLARHATIVLLGLQGDPLVIPYMPFLVPGHRIIASTEASRKNHIEALTFAARHNIKPWIEEFPLTVQGLTEALDRLAKGKTKYRAVLTATSDIVGSSLGPIYI